MENIQKDETVVMGYTLSEKVTWRLKLRRKLFPNFHCDLPEAPSEFQDVIHLESTAKFTFIDRLRILITGKIRIKGKIVCEYATGKTVPALIVYPYI